MSIINEALKKTEKYIHQNQDKDKLPVKTTSGPKPVLVYILVLLAGILLTKFIFAKLNPPQEKKKPLSISLASVTSKETPVQAPRYEEVALPQENNRTTQTTFILNGIFFSDNDGYALVNNQIVRENDAVDGAKVIRISVNNVELETEGKIISLSAGR